MVGKQQVKDVYTVYCAVHNKQLYSHSLGIQNYVKTFSGKMTFHFDLDNSDYYKCNDFNLLWGTYLE